MKITKFPGNMGNTVQQHRQAIGAFYNRGQRVKAGGIKKRRLWKHLVREGLQKNILVEKDHDCQTVRLSDCQTVR